MKTEISEFCKEYSSALIPAGAALDAVIEQIERDSQEDVLRLNLAGLNEVKHRLKSLIDKVEGQQAYLLIFGPLKSGKSTLMNAISGAYVSEVTSLPAYPCLVYVRHGDKSAIKLTRYNGRETGTEDKNVMEVLINDSHTNLADRIRTVEEAGREFDPGLDYPEAIRRIDIDLTAHELNESGTVLVDTPGLYSRMKFGYDLMTREFRNSAACAVFVVKTDNLFLEQVFEEFNDLLGLFSRVFLVVNIDSSKRDLRPDGTLKPSLESEDPQKIIDAFQLLSMSAALRRASAEGRLKIYPIDLLNAASQHLMASNSTVGDAGSAGETAEARLERARSGRPDDFRAFLNDLTEYLNSSDYLFELMNDSFRQGDLLREEVLRNCATESIQDFIVQQRRLRDDISELETQMEAVKSLSGFDWDKAFESTHADVEQEASRFAKDVKADLEKSLRAGIDNWFETPESLGDLVHKTWKSRMDDLQKQMASKVSESVKNVVDSSSGGARPSPEIVRSLDHVKISLRDIYTSAVKTLSEEPKVAECGIDIDVDDIPINRTFWDRIFFQSQAKVRRRLLGSTSELKNEVAPHKKRKRLLPDGKAGIEASVDDQLKGTLPGVPARCSRDYLKRYIEQFKSEFTALLKQREKEFSAKCQQLQTRVEANDRISSSFEKLDTVVTELEKETTELKGKFLRSARLARGFQVIHQGIGAHSLWTAPYCGGVALVPGTQQAQEELPEVVAVETAPMPSGAFTIWTSQFLPGSHSTQESSVPAPQETAEVEETESVVITLPVAEAVSELGPEASDEDDAEAVVDAEGGESEAASSPAEPMESTDDADGSGNGAPAEPVRIIPKAPDSE